ncbi:ATP-dependent DNA helicase recG [Methanosarcina siciliae HI350]|uniref:ATP-dependent DNA helicase recG n=1 Tax=Methanosarcina siciliae HI350 TaxID=1434119 RepID=A0A0E3PEE8_9EURY|nr:RNA-binding domain-containing protein [Methanosarcina siciliae]AKB32607.1 ATP-dependent DNA helicase recG [Methanosarcina siciliae HI350]
MNRDELLEKLHTFEWNDFECKKASREVPEDAYKTVSAFANTAGGWLVFGVQERNRRLEIAGVEEVDRIQNNFLSTLRSGQKLNRIIQVQEKKYEIEGKHLLAFYIPESPRNEKPIYLKGDPRQSYIRRGAGDEQCTQSELERFLRDASLLRYDSEPASEIPVDSFFDENTVRWYQAQFFRRNPEHDEIEDPIEFLLNWNYIIEQDKHMLPTRAGVLLFGKGRYVRQLLPRPVLDYQRIDTSFEQWSPEERWHDRYVFEENIFQTWRGLVARYMRIAEHPFSLDPDTFRRIDDPPDYIAFREAAINLLVHQDYGDHSRKASIKLFTDRTIFWNPGDAFATEAELLDPTEKELRNPSIIKAFRRIGLSDQAGTGIRAIYRNWHELGRVPPKIHNDKARKQFELILFKKPLITEKMLQFQHSLGVTLSAEQAEVMALAVEQKRITLTDIRGLVGGNFREAKAAADYLVHQQLLEMLDDTLFKLPDDLINRYDNLTPAAVQAGSKTLKVTTEVTTEVTPEVTAVGTKLGPSWDQVGTKLGLSLDQMKLLTNFEGPHSITELMEWVGRTNRTKFREEILNPLLETRLVEMTIPDKPRSSKQKYRLTEKGRELQAQLSHGDDQK